MLCCSCRQLLSTTIVHGYSRSTIIIVQSLLTTINKLVSSTIVDSCSNNIATTFLFFVNFEQLLIEQYSSVLSFQQVLLNLVNNIVEALFSEQRCKNVDKDNRETPTTEESRHRGLTSDKTRITKSLASARWRGSHPPENFNMAGIFFLKRIQQNMFPDQTDGFMLR